MQPRLRSTENRFCNGPSEVKPPKCYFHRLFALLRVSLSVSKGHRPLVGPGQSPGLGRADSGARSWAILVSLIHSARLNGHDPGACLRDVLERVVSGRTKANQLDTLLP
ncbi:MAG: hypothetical protein GC191_15390 [Azospirillum sp.]|nr:hypothetical protein [Azospirillum sp.]